MMCIFLGEIIGTMPLVFLGNGVVANIAVLLVGILVFSTRDLGPRIIIQPLIPLIP